MPPRYSYWTIIAGGLPTAFRAADREELLPTFHRLKEKHPDAEMKWFARGKLWESPEAARAQGSYPSGDRRPGRNDGGETRDGGRREPAAKDRGERRGRDWRPGGEHRDPRQKYKDAKKARNVDRRQQKFARKQGAGGDAGAARPKWTPERRDDERPRGDTPRFDKPSGR